MPNVSIVSYEPKYQPFFRALNLAWIERYFAVEPADLAMLDHPEAVILAAGGHILFAQYGGETVGTVALLQRGGRCFELAKMAVCPKAQGKHIGKALLLAAIATAKAHGATTLVLETNDSLTPAVNLYRSVGFVPDTPQPVAKYKRVNLVMTLELGL